MATPEKPLRGNNAARVNEGIMKLGKLLREGKAELDRTADKGVDPIRLLASYSTLLFGIDEAKEELEQVGRE